VAEVWYGGRSNKRPHYVPVTLGVLDKATNSSAYIFPSPVYKDQPIQTERPTLKRLSKLIQFDFRGHDLRRTFATRASEVGTDYLTIKRMLNHKRCSRPDSLLELPARPSSHKD
jgi:integrase